MWFFRGCEHLIRSYDGTHQTMETLKQFHRLGIITNGDFRRQHNKFMAITFHDYFDSELLVCSGAVGYERPDPEIFRYALQTAGVEPREALMVGDWAMATLAEHRRPGCVAFGSTQRVSTSQRASRRTQRSSASMSCPVSFANGMPE